jgi:LPS export ABC transporter protein LptC
VAEQSKKQLRSLNYRAQLPKFARAAAIVVMALTLIAVGIGYYRAKSNSEFRMAGFPTELSKDVVASISGYERRESDGEVLKYYIKADTATTFSDDHQELENVYLQVFDDTGASDEITARKAVYIPGENKTFTSYFAGNVVISSRDKLKLRTEQVAYAKATEIATADEDVEFERFNVKGRSFGASLDLGKRLLELNRTVSFEVAGDAGSYSKLTAGRAIYDQGAERVELLEGASLDKHDPAANATFVDSRLRANRAVAHLIEQNQGSRVLDRVELFDNVDVERNDNGSTVTMRSRNGSYSRGGDRFELNQEIAAKFVRGDSVYDVRSTNAVYEPSNFRVQLTGDARIQNDGDQVTGQSLVAYLNSANMIKKVEVEGNAQLRQNSQEYITDISSSSLSGEFDNARTLTRADTKGKSEIVRTSANGAGPTKLTVTAASALHTIFRGRGTMDSMQSEGRTTVRLDVPDNGTDSANRSVTADTVKTVFQSDGRNLKRAEAVGNAEFMSTPHRPSSDNYALQTYAPHFDCDFYGGRNDPKTCVASDGTKTTRNPTVPREGRGGQTITSTRFTISFDERTSGISRMDATGKAKFTELDRAAIADSFGLSTADEMIQLRGGEPTAWDSKARIKAKEIDWDMRNSRSAYRRSVSSTYYNTKSVGNASPFGDESKPFYVTSDAAELDHNGEVGLFTGNARGWQGNNYVRGDRLELRQRESQMKVSGGVQSLLYDVKKTRQGSDSSVPVFAAAAEMLYDGNARTVRYERSVDIRQGSDRMTGSSALIRLNERNEMVQTNIDSQVSVSQSGRKAYADALVYTAADERLMLRGRPARVEDKERGSTQGEELVVYLNDNRMTGEGRSKSNPTGRVRNTYKVN